MNIAVLLARAGQAHHNRLALKQGDYELSYGQLNDRVASCTGALRGLGIGPGDRVALLQHNSPTYAETMLATLRNGSIIVPLNPRLHPSEIVYILQHCGARLLLYGRDFSESVEQSRRECSIPNYIDVGGEAGNTSTAYEALLASHAPVFADARVDEDDTAWLFYTSGTTGHSKGAMLTHRNLLHMVMNFYVDHHVAGETDVALYLTPLSHGAGPYFLPVLARGAAHVFHASRRFDAALVSQKLNETA